MWRKVCTFLLLAISLGKINYKACSSDPVWILKLLQKQFSPRGDQEEVKGLPIKQINIAGQGQNLGKLCDTSPLQSYSFSFTCAKWPNVSADFGYQSLWKPLERDPPGFAPPVHGVIIDLTLIRFLLKCMWPALTLRSYLSYLEMLFPSTSKHPVSPVSTTYTEKANGREGNRENLAFSKDLTKVQFLTQFSSTALGVPVLSAVLWGMSGFSDQLLHHPHLSADLKVPDLGRLGFPPQRNLNPWSSLWQEVYRGYSPTRILVWASAFEEFITKDIELINI